MSLQCTVTSLLLRRGPITSLFICQKVDGIREMDEEVWELGRLEEKRSRAINSRMKGQYKQMAQKSQR